MKVKIKKSSLIYLSILIITFSESIITKKWEINNLLEIIGFFFLLSGIFVSYKNLPNNKIKRKLLYLYICTLLLLSIGFIWQDISVVRALTLIAITVALATISCLSFGYITNEYVIRSASYAVFVGILMSAILGALFGVGIIDVIVGGYGIFGIPIGLNGGVVYKNYFAADMLMVFIGLYVFGKYQRLSGVDRLVMFIAFLSIMLANSRGGIILFFVFILSTNYKYIMKLKKNQRVVFLIFSLTIVSFLVYEFYKNIILGFSTYAYRYRGMLNYINYYSDDWFHLLLGNSESFYDKSVSYVMMVRSTTGYNGSLEISWLNIIIKNGILGVIAYVMIFAMFLKMAKNVRNKETSSLIIAIAITLLASSLVEAYIQSVHCIFAVLGYLIINALYFMGVNQKEKIGI